MVCKLSLPGQARSSIVPTTSGRRAADSEGWRPLVGPGYDARRGSAGDGSGCAVSAEKAKRVTGLPEGRRRSTAAPTGERERLQEEATALTARAGRRRNDRRDEPAEERALLELLSRGLSEEEIQRVLACALLVLAERGRERLFARLGAETGATLRRLLASRARSGAKAPPSPGSAKIREEWDKAWSEWEACVAESGDEDGRYVVREHHWEEPYLDASSLAEDLEPLAVRMRKILERVIEEELDPDFSFLAAIQDLDAEIGSGLPEWMDPSSGDGCSLGPEVTRCLLDWEWRACRRDGRSPFELVDAIRKVEASAKTVSLDGGTIARFIGGLGDAEQQAILTGIASHRSASHWSTVLGAAHSGWFKIHQALARRWDPALFEEASRKNIAQDWKLALPLVADLLRRKSFDQASPLIEAAVRALLRLKTGETWDPRETLLISRPVLRYGSDSPADAFRLLESWRKVATGLGQDELASALELQVAVGRRWADGDAALEAFRQVRSPRFVSLRDRLFADWRSLVIEATLECQSDEREPPGSVWVQALVDAARAGADGAASFRGVVREWLDETRRTPATLQKSRDALGTLTLDLDVGSTLRRTSPTLHRLLSTRPKGEPAVTASRRRWVERLGVGDLFPEVLEFWRRHVARLVPDPASATGSHYDDCAEWLAAVFELDSAAYRCVVQGWAGPHARRKNLWLAIARKHLPR